MTIWKKDKVIALVLERADKKKGFASYSWLLGDATRLHCSNGVEREQHVTQGHEQNTISGVLKVTRWEHCYSAISLICDSLNVTAFNEEYRKRYIPCCMSGPSHTLCSCPYGERQNSACIRTVFYDCNPHLFRKNVLTATPLNDSIPTTDVIRTAICRSM
jgi:hypothetical protein